MNIWIPAIRTGSGADIFTERLASALADKGINTTVTWFNRFYEFVPALLKNTEPPADTDIIHVNSWYGFAFKRPGKKLVITVHLCIHDPLFFQYKTPLQRFYHDYLIRNYETSGFRVADRVTAVSNYTANIVKKLFNIEPPIPVYNGIDTVLFKPADNRIIKDRFTLLYVGNMTRRKGFDLLKPIMEKLGNDFILKYTSGFRKCRHATAENMENIGLLDQESLVRAYNDCDALLFPSRLEGFGYSVCEAMACGKPVISSNNSSLSEIIRQGETGMLCTTNAVDEFCDAARTLASDPGLVKKMGSAARKDVVEKFSSEKMAEKYIKLYESLL